MRSIVRLVVLGAADAWALVALRPDLARLAAPLTEPSEGAGLDAAAVPLAAAAVWLLALWLAVGLLAALAARAPGVLGRGADRVARTVLPPTLRRLLAGATGIGIVLAPVSAAAATGGPATAPATHAVAPSAAPGCAAVLATARPPLPAPTWPTTAGGPSARTGSAERVVVQPGDSLWLIAANRLGPHAGAAAVAAEWPRWYAANRSTIGPDPDLLQPGQVLRAPAGGAA